MNRTLLAARAVALLLALSPVATAVDAESELEAIRRDLLEARLDEALGSLNELLGRDDLSNDAKVEALALRAQARGATGSFDGAEEDYREILMLRPGFRPDPSSTAKRALQRFEALQSAMTGLVEFQIDPPDATVLVDSRTVRPDADGKARVLAGKRIFRIERKGFDTADIPVEIAAGEVTPVRADLAPNARTLILRTDIDEVEVFIDDVPLGKTSRVEDPDPIVRATRPAEITLEAVPAGEHVLTLKRPCYRTVRLHELVSVDVLDRSPKVIGPIVLQAARTVIELTGAPPSGEVRVDGTHLTDLPFETPPEVCAGARRIEIRSGGRSVWSETVEVPPGERLTLSVNPRPNVVLVGATRWPSSLGDLERAWSTVEVLPNQGKRLELTSTRDWKKIDLPVDADLALAVLADGGVAASQRWVLYSPMLDTVSGFSVVPEPGSPIWIVPDLGITATESREEGVVVTAVDSEGPAANVVFPGERVRSIGERDIRGLEDWRVAVSSLTIGEEHVLRIGSPRGESREVRVRARESFRAGLAPDSAIERAIHAGWSAAVGASGGREAPAAWTDLGVLLELEGRLAGALDALRRSAWPEREGIGPGSVHYLSGRVLSGLGREEEARDAFRRAAETDARLFEDDGPSVAPAARDHLADLGVGR